MRATIRIIASIAFTFFTNSTAYGASQEPLLAIRTSPTGVTDSSGVVWRTDAYAVGVSKQNSTAATISGTSDSELYQTERTGTAFGYSIPVKPGTYQVVLKFAEITYASAGQRVFNILINNKIVQSSFDPFVASGNKKNAAIDKFYTASPVDGKIGISFTALKGDPKISAIEIVPVPKVAINSGSTSLVDVTGLKWSSDVGFTTPTKSTTACNSVTVFSGTHDQGLYNCERYSTDMTYSFTLPNGNYQVVMKFAEVAVNAANSRLFNVSIENSDVIKNLDLFVEGGNKKYVAIDKVFKTTVSDGKIDIRLYSSKNNAEVRAISITPIPNIFYMSNLGLDTNDGMSAAKPWKTMAHLNAKLAANLLRPGDSVLFRRGDTWRDDYLKCLNLVSATAATTLMSNPPNCSGTYGSPVVFGAYGSGANPLIDGSDPLNLSWKLVAAGTYSASSNALPMNLYVGASTSEVKALLPAVNTVASQTTAGTFLNSKDLKYLDQVQYTDTAKPASPVVHAYVCLQTSGCPIGSKFNNRLIYVDLSNSDVNGTTQAFPFNTTGLQNVESTPGSFYANGTTIYVHLLDSSNPSGKTFSQPIRDHGVHLASVNYVTVQSLSIAKTLRSGILANVYSNPSLEGAYITNQGLTLNANATWNIGTNALESMTDQNHATAVSVPVAGILMYPFISYTSAYPNSNYIINNKIGAIDTYFGLRYTSGAGVFVYEQDALTVKGNNIQTQNVAGIVYGTRSGIDNNQKGVIANNDLSNNAQGNIMFGQNDNGRVTSNIIHDSKGEGIQLGGQGLGFMVDHNVIYNIDRSGSGNLYNGIDCNGGGLVTGSIIHNTIWNTNSASISMENINDNKANYHSPGCLNMTVRDNIFSQADVTPDKYNYLASVKGNPSYSMYVTSWIYATHSWHFDHNMWDPGTNPKPWSTGSTCATFVGNYNDVASTCNDPQFTDAKNGNFKLKSTSPARNRASDGTDLGAIAYAP